MYKSTEGLTGVLGEREVLGWESGGSKGYKIKKYIKSITIVAKKHMFLG